MAICSSVQNIAASECIGDSLVKINNNFSNLNEDTCTLLTLLNNLSASIPQPGSVIKTHYVDLLGPQRRSGNTLPLNVFSPDPNFPTPTLTTGHGILSATVALTNPNNYFIIQTNVAIASDGAGETLAMVFAGSTLIAARTLEAPTYSGRAIIVKHAPGNTNNITYSFRGAAAAGYGDLMINQNFTLGGRYGNFWPTGKSISSMLIQEIKG